MYLGSSGHQNLKKELPEESPPPEPPMSLFPIPEPTELRRTPYAAFCLKKKKTKTKKENDTT